MSLTIMSGPSDASRTTLRTHFRVNGSEMSGHSRGGSWVSDNTPIPWSGPSSNDAASSSTARPQSSTYWRSSSSSHLSHSHPHLIAPTFEFASNSRSGSARSIGMGGVASRSRVSMDAVPAEDDSTSEHDHESHHTISPTSSSASLPDMADQPPAPPPFPGVGQAALILGGATVGLGLPSYLGGTGRPDWPVVRDIGADAGESDEEDIDQHEMDTYQASHRAPVDATLRSMPGVVALGDGWASGSQSKQKKRWFRRGKKEETAAVVDDDPLALWSSSSGGASHESPMTQKEDPNAKWWRSRRSLFTSQRALASSTGLTPSTPTAGENKASQRPVGKGRAWVNRSRLNFGSMVDLSRLQDKRSSSTNATPTTASAPISAITPTSPAVRTPPKTRHSVGGFLRKAPPHPLDLSHGSKSNAAASRSQPVLVAASSSQPTFFPSPSQEHPLLRMSYARSESHLAGAGSPGIPPRPVVDNGPMSRPTAMSSMPMWRPQAMSPTPLLEVEEEDEEDPDWSQDSPERPALKRTATFGDDGQQQHPSATPTPTPVATAPPTTTTALPVAPNPPVQRERVSQAPGLPTVAGSPHEPLRTLSSASTSDHHTTPHQHVSLLGKIKNVLTRGKGRSSNGGIHSPSLKTSATVPESPRSTQSEQPQPTTPTRASLLPPPRSVGHGLRHRSRLWSRRDLSKDQPAMPENRGKAEKKASYRVSQHVAESLINLSPAANHETDPASRRNSSASAMSSSSRRRRRLSSFTPIPASFRAANDESDEGGSEKEERRRSIVTLRRFTSQSKQRPALGTVFPRPPESVDQPPPLHWAFPGSYSTPMLHKFGGSTLSLALDISSADVDDIGLHDIQETPTPVSPTRVDPETLAMQRERALSATIATLTSRQQVPKGTTNDSPPVRLSLSSPPRGRRHSVPVNIDSLTNSSADSLTLPAVNMVNFPLPPSSSGNTSSPDPDQVEQLRTPSDGTRQYPHHQDIVTLVDAGETSDGSTGSRGSAASSHGLRKQPSWSTCKTSSAAGTSLTPIATPTSFISSNGAAAQEKSSAYKTARESYTSLIEDDAAPYMAQAMNASSPPHPIVA